MFLSLFLYLVIFVSPAAPVLDQSFCRKSPVTAVLGEMTKETTLGGFMVCWSNEVARETAGSLDLCWQLGI